MKNTFDKFNNGNMIAQNFYKNLGINNTFNQMLESHTLLNNYAGISFSQQLMKGVNNLYKNFAGFESLSRTLQIQANLYQVPYSSLEAFTEIIHVQKVFFDDLKGLSKAIIESQMPFLNQVNNLEFAMTGISEQILKIATHHRNWQLINDFEEINEQAFDLTINSDEIFIEENVKFQQLIDTVFEFIEKNKHLGKKAYSFLNLIVLLYGVYQIYDSFQTKPKAFTKEDMAKFESKIFKAIELKFKEHKEYRVTNRISKIMFKPKTKTIIIVTLPQNYQVTILSTNHKWAFISYTNPKDNLMETGWVMKKYLDKIK